MPLGSSRIPPHSQLIAPIVEINNEINGKLIEKNPFLWLTSYIFNQENMQLDSHCYYKMYRTFFLFKSALLRNLIEEKYKMSLEVYIMTACYLFATFSRHYCLSEKSLYKQYKDSKDQSTFLSTHHLKKILSKVSISFADIRNLLTKEYKVPDNPNLVFNFYNNSLHIVHPIYTVGQNYYCVVPTYIFNSLLDGIYSDLELYKEEKEEPRKEYAANVESYVNGLFDYYLRSKGINYVSEIVYDNSQKTSDFIIWAEQDVLFLDCKTKHLQIASKGTVELDNDIIDSLVLHEKMSNREIETYKRSVKSQLTKDLIDLGIDLGKVFVCYDKCLDLSLPELTFPKDARCTVGLVTIDNCFAGTPDYKDTILKIAQWYRNLKNQADKKIEEESVIFLSLKDIEEYSPIIGRLGLSFFLNQIRTGNWPKLQEVHEPNKYLVEKFEKEVWNDIFQEIENVALRKMV